MSEWYIIPSDNDLMHYGTKGMKWRHKKAQYIAPSGPGYHGMPSNIKLRTQKQTGTALRQRRTATLTKRYESDVRKKDAEVAPRSKNLTAQRTVLDMVVGKKKLDKQYIMDNWSRIKNNPSVVRLLRAKYPMIYRQASTKLHTGGGGGRY